MRAVKYSRGTNYEKIYHLNEEQDVQERGDRPPAFNHPQTRAAVPRLCAGSWRNFGGMLYFKQTPPGIRISNAETYQNLTFDLS